MIKIYSIYQPEFYGLTCVLKYYKLLDFIPNLPGTYNEYWTLFNRYLGSNPDSKSNTARTFFPFPDIDYKEKKTHIAQLTLFHCAKVYLFSFLVRFLEILYII